MKNIKTFFMLTLITLTITIFNCTNAVIILTHGSFGTQSKWNRPTGVFYQELEKQAKKLNLKLVSFSWSGRPTYNEIFIGAQRLAKLILSYPPNEKIILIGHSHGGNIINIASQLLHDPIYEIIVQYSSITASELLEQMPTNIQLGVNVNPETCPLELEQSQLSGLSYTYTNKDYPLCKFLKTLLKIKELKKLQKNISFKTQKKYLIDKAYLLGTPVDINRYNPEMKVIQNLYNFYSTGDLVQPVFGLFNRTYPEHKRLANLEITIKQSGLLCNGYPTHTQIHDITIAQWLLHIPENLSKKKVGNFEKFNYKNGKINFGNNDSPTYQTNNKIIIKSQEQASL